MEQTPIENKPFVSLKNINKIYPNGVQAVFDFNLNINQNDFVILVGPSGCGKSTTLRMIAGLEDISDGEFYINDELANFMPSKDRHIAMVFQSYALYPNMTVYENMAFGLKIQKLDPEEIEKRVFEAAKILDLGRYLDRKPKELSGGQMQRVALGRAIVRHAPIFLMDEPLSNLDAKLRVSMRAEIVRIHKAVGSTTIYVTHDQVEAMTMATKIVVMNAGFVQQIGSPDEIYANPNNAFVATFIGTPSMNLFKVNCEGMELKFKDGLQYKNINAFKSAYSKFLETKINEIKEVLKKDEKTIFTYYKHLCSNCISFESNKYEKIVIEEKKQNFFKKLFSKKDKKNNDVKEESFKQDLENILAQLNSNLTASHDVLVGVRPEKIKLRKLKEGEDTNNKILITAEVCELLGSEYNIYFSLEGKSIIGKMNNETKIVSGDKFVLDISDNDFYIFDEVTGQRII